MTVTTLPAITDNEKKVLLAIRFNWYGNSDGPGYEAWSLQIDDSSRPSKLPGRTLAGVCGSLVKKGLAYTGGSGREQWIALTQTGFDLAKDD